MSFEKPKKLWSPDKEFIEESNLSRYKTWLAQNKSLDFETYDALWQWSIDHLEVFWQSIVEFFEVQFHHEYDHVLKGTQMPYFKWFEGSTLNYAEHVFRNATSKYPAIIFKNENETLREISWQELEHKVSCLVQFFKDNGVKKGDRIAAYISNIPEATIAFLAACSIGAIWSSCSPDFGIKSVIDRFDQIKPVVFLCVTNYQYGGRLFDKKNEVEEVLNQLDSVRIVIEVPILNAGKKLKNAVSWHGLIVDHPPQLEFTALPFDHPIWILYSSGTTGRPKAITHSQGGVLIEHLKYISLHNDVKKGERFFWFTTSGWMMWNYLNATLLCGATVVFYDGSPAYPDLYAMWDLVDKAGIHHFGTSAPFIEASMKKGVLPNLKYSLPTLKSISSTGSPLSAEGFDWIYNNVKNKVWLISMSGGTDVCSAFVGGCVSEPVYQGEIQRRALGCALFSYDSYAQKIFDEFGEMVITEPMPSMPIFFWGDEKNEKYKSSYFNTYDSVWRHGDWVQITNRNTIIIKGRSDATLNRHGIRIGTAEIYQSVDKINGIKDSLVVHVEMSGYNDFMPLFVVMQNGLILSDEIGQTIKKQINADYSPRHVPDLIIEVPDIPYTISGKKMEEPVKKILKGEFESISIGGMRNPESLQAYRNYFEKHFPYQKPS